ncbi:hypothetical protein V7S43_016138 [Phytophthora oleae]|uniref:Uncharacterized protein n=1 Tax=Phytophthora oleae TaxID=2107226 RepID=A0ABD3EXD4_9STRA
MVVTGNPGAGLSRFYLYFAFQLLRRHDGKVQELPPFELVLNSEDAFHKYCAKDDTFIELDKAEIRDLSKQRSVLRLIEGNSSRLLGWKGVSILLANCGLKGLRSYANCNSFTYYVPMWSLCELQDYNSVFSDTLKLPDKILVERFDKYGGNPRCIFTETQPENDANFNRAIAVFDALKVVSYAECNTPVRDKDLSSCVLQMVSSDSNFRAN